MPVRKFRSVAEMDGPRWREPGDALLYGVMADLWDIGWRSRRRYPPGVHRHASVEDVARAHEAWAAEFPRAPRS